MLTVNNPNNNGFYPDFIYRLEDFVELFLPLERYTDKIDLIFLYSFIIAKKPKHILEIGRAYGCSTLAMLGAITNVMQGTLTSVDIDYKLYGDVERILKNKVSLITCDSKDILSIEEVKNKSYDFIFIDGDHSYEAVKLDLINCNTIAANNAFFALHDIWNDNVIDAIRYVCSINEDLNYIGKFNGIGLIIKGMPQCVIGE